MKKPTIMLVIIITVLVIFWLYYIFYSSACQQKTVEKFINKLLNNDSDYVDLLDKQIYNHPFIKLFSNNKYFDNYRIASSESIGNSQTKMLVYLKYKDSGIKVPLTLTKKEKKWIISSLPNVTKIQSAIPTNIKKLENNSMEYIFLTGGTALTCTYPSVKTQISIGTPVALLLLEDNIIDYKFLIPTSITKLLSSSSNWIEDIYRGIIPISKSIDAYLMNNGQLEYIPSGFIPIGSHAFKLYCSDDGLGRVVLLKNTNLPKEKIRVVLHNRDNSSVFHSKLQIKCDQPFYAKVLVTKQPLKYEFKKDDTITIKSDNNSSSLYYNGNKLASTSHRWHIESNNSAALFSLITTNNIENPRYRGKLEVIFNESGLILNNEVDLEQYLYSVVPSEMPVKFGIEALKVQSISARSYAVRCFNSMGFAAFGGNVDDSTASQVYNSANEDPIAIEAVNSTCGLVPFYDNKIADTRFFSTSCGYTANFHEVWSDNSYNFPSSKIPYLIALPQYSGDSPSLYNEENFRAFLNNNITNAYDRFSPFYRWNISMTREEMEAAINHNLPVIQRSQREFILTRQNNNQYVEKIILDNVGELLNIQVLKRGQGGNIMELEISTTQGTFKIIKELNIRQTLKPINYTNAKKTIDIQCHDGSVRGNFPILPSAFAYIDLERDKDGHIQSINIKGGGYGHGVGMSQSGTYGLTLLGNSYADIIQHYYPGTVLKNIYEINE